VPAWVGGFVAADWDEPDAAERAMTGGCPSMRPWPDDVHKWHAGRRWLTARNAWLDAHPEHDHRLAELLAAFGDEDGEGTAAGLV
jgi:hypothetical protein